MGGHVQASASVCGPQHGQACHEGRGPMTKPMTHLGQLVVVQLGIAVGHAHEQPGQAARRTDRGLISTAGQPNGDEGPRATPGNLQFIVARHPTPAHTQQAGPWPPGELRTLCLRCHSPGELVVGHVLHEPDRRGRPGGAEQVSSSAEQRSMPPTPAQAEGMAAPPFKLPC